MLTTCSEPGCATLVMGGRCVEHERPPARIFVRGRPFTPLTPHPGMHTAVAGEGAATLTATGSLRTLEFRKAHSGLEPPRY